MKKIKTRHAPVQFAEAFQQKTGSQLTATHGLIKIKTENIFSAKNLQLYDLPGHVSLPESNQAIQKDEFPLLSALRTCFVAWA